MGAHNEPVGFIDEECVSAAKNDLVFLSKS